MKRRVLIFVLVAMMCIASILVLSACNGSTQQTDVPSDNPEPDQPKVCQHEWEVVTTVEATCTTQGHKITVCKFCQTILREENIDPLGHDLVVHPAQNATCTEDGWKSYRRCSRCIYEIKTDIPAKGHKFVTVKAKAATCTEDGYDAHKECLNCGMSEEEYEIYPKLGHDYVHHDAQEQTCDAVGWGEYDTCTRCTYSTYEEIPKHHFVKDECVDCGYSKWCDYLELRLINDNMAYEVVGFKGDVPADMVIPASHKGIPIIKIGESAFDSCSIRSITIGKNVSSISKYAFYDCPNLTTVNWNAENCYYGGNQAESKIFPKTITRINLGEDVRIIPAGSFYQIKNLTEITIPENVTRIGDHAFAGCENLTTVNWAAVNCTYAGNSSSLSAFCDCQKLKAVNFGNKVETIPDYVFSGRSNLTSIKFGDNIKSIGEAAFWGCSGLTSLSIPDTLETLGYEAFESCNNLRYNGYDNAYYLGNATNPHVVLMKATDTSITACQVHSNTKIIGYKAFYCCTALQNIVLPDGVKFIGDSAFYECSDLPSISLPSSVIGIDDRAFANCNKITEVVIPEKVTYIGGYAFDKCKQLKSVTIPAALTSIGEYAFNECNGLKGVYIEDLAAWCNISYKYEYKESTPMYHAKNLYLDGELISGDLVIPEGVQSIGPYAFYHCDQIQSIMIPSTLTKIGESAFGGCNGLTDVYIEDLAAWCSISYKGRESSPMVFAKNLHLNGELIAGDLVIPEGVQSISPYAFSHCDNLTSVVIPEGVTNIGEYAFSQCYGLISVVIPSSMTKIGGYAFNECFKLVEVFNKSSLSLVAQNTNHGYVAYYANNIYKVEGESKLATDGNGFVIFNGTTIVGYVGTATEIIIPDGIDCIYRYAFNNCSHITSVTIGNGVTSIGDYAFRGCSSLESITLPFVGARANTTSSDKYQYPFGYIFGTSSYTGGTETKQYYYSSTSSTTYSTYYIPSSLKSVTITGGNILYGAFYNCSGLTSISIPDSVTSIGNYAFYECSGLTSITIPENVTSIGKYAFHGCSGISSVTINDKVTSIGDYAFYGCSGIPGVTIPDSVTSIGAFAFAGCVKFTSIVIPDSVTKIGGSAFNGCSLIESMTIPFVGEDVTITSSDKYQYPFGYIFGTTSYDGCVATDQIYYYKTDRETTRRTTFYIPSSLRSVTVTGGNILYCAFMNCRNLTSITLPSNLTSIGSCAFSNCVSLTSITIPSGVESIGSSAFNECSGLQSIIIPDKVKEIGSSAFYECIGLTSMVIPDGVLSIGDAAFGKCVSLESITLPFVGASANTTSSDTYQYPFGYIFGTSSYAGGTETKQSYYGSSTSGTTSSTYYIPTKLKSVTITGGKILPYAFYNCNNLTSITLSPNAKYVEKYAFYNCTGLTAVNITDFAAWCLIEFGNEYANPLYYAKNLYLNDELVTGDLVIPDGIRSIGNYSFYNYDKLTSVTLPSSIKSIKNNAFFGCSGLTAVYCTDIVSWCDIRFSDKEANPLYYAKNLYLNGELVTGDLVIPDGIKNIGNNAFYDYDKLTSVTIPSSVKNIYNGAFHGCTNLQSVTIPDGVTSIGDHTFEGCYGLTSVTIPSSVVYIGYSSFYACSGLQSVTMNDGVEEIGSSAFSGCGGLTNIVIPDSVTSIGSAVFYGCHSLESITLPFVGNRAGVTSSDTYQYPFGYIFGTSSYFGGSVTTQYYYGPSISSTAVLTCYIPTTLKSVTITGGNILYGAFYNCNKLTSVTIGNKVESISRNAFYGCSELQAVYIEDLAAWCNIKFVSVDSNPLYYAKKLYLNGELVTDLVIPNTVTEIKDYAFCNCSGLTSVTIPDNVTSIGLFAFDGCSGLTTVHITDLAAWCNISFGNYCANPLSYAKKLYLNGELVTDLVIPNTVTEIKDYAFYNCTAFTSVTIPSSVTSIGNYVFSGCSGLTSVTISDSVTSIGNRAFNNCSGLTSITIPWSVTSIGNYVFSGCSKLTSITFTDTTTWYRTSAISSWENKTNGTETSVEDSSTNATNFKSNYETYYWYKL